MNWAWVRQIHARTRGGEHTRTVSPSSDSTWPFVILHSGRAYFDIVGRRRTGVFPFISSMSAFPISMNAAAPSAVATPAAAAATSACSARAFSASPVTRRVALVLVGVPWFAIWRCFACSCFSCAISSVVSGLLLPRPWPADAANPINPLGSLGCNSLAALCVIILRV